MRRLFNNFHGMSLIELLVIVVVIGIMVSVAMQSITANIDDIRRVATEREMESLAEAIVGNPSLASNGKRADFGYVGDIGAFPPNLEALRTNPGGWSTWDGPYLTPGFTQDTLGFKIDEWGAPYVYSGSVVLTSTGSGASLTRQIAGQSTDYLNNTYCGLIRDADDSTPRATYQDSIQIVMAYPNGAGGTTFTSRTPDPSGAFSVNSLPVGVHPVRVIYIPAADTLFRFVTILPRHRNDPYDIYRFSESYFSGTGPGPSPVPGLTLIAGSVSVSGGTCDKITFEVANNSGAGIVVSAITLTWSGPTSFYEKISFGGTVVQSRTSGLPGSGTLVTFSAPQTVADGATSTMIVERFRQSAGGGGARVAMNNVPMTVLFSESSTVTFNTGACQ